MAQPIRPSVMAALAVVFALALIVPSPTAAQSLYGSIVGTVSDAQGAAIPGAAVVATNARTGFTTQTVTGAGGNYAFRNLQPGLYDLSVSLQGFREHKQTELRVTAGNPVRVDLKLEVGTLEETVNVVSESTLLQTEKADLHTEISAKEVVDLPLNQFRNYQALLNLAPGATPATFQNAEIDTPGRSLRTWVNGTQPNSNAFRIDGAVSVNIWLPHHAGYISPAETIETVNAATNNFDADQGMAAGAAVTVITKSGTNELHGSAFWFRNQDELNANTLFNNAFGLDKPSLSRNIYGGTLGGPIVKNKLFFFGSWERFQDRRGFTQTFGVPTARMRAGDFSEVAAAYAGRFQIYDPATGGAGGAGRTPFPGYTIPANRLDPIAQQVLSYYPLPNTDQDLNSNQVLDDYFYDRTILMDRDNFDVKLTWQRSNTHSVWAKFGMLDNEGTGNNFVLGFDEGSIGDTRVYVGTIGHTWTLSPTLVLDGNLGINHMDQTVTGPDYGTNYGLELGIPGTNGDSIRYSGLPLFDIQGFAAGTDYDIGGTPGWMPLFRRERSWTFSSALTKVLPQHEIRAGIDIVRHELNHWQPEWGGGVRGGLRFGTLTTSTPGYTPLGWNGFAGFLLGLQTENVKDVQNIEMSGREWQGALYVRDRWQVSQKLTVSLGLRLEYYPLMGREGRNSIERLDFDSYTLLLGGLGDVPEDLGLDLKKWYLAPRLGVMYRLSEKSVIRAGYGRTFNPLPWSRPMRGSYPFDVWVTNTADQYSTTGTLRDGIPPVPIPDISSGRVPFPRGAFMRTPHPGDVDRGVIQQWNVAYEQRLPGDISIDIAYVGSATDGGYADLNVNYGEPGGGNASRQYFAVAGTTTINDWASRTRSRYKALQLAINRPFRNGLMLKGAYTLSQAKDMTTNGEDGWVGLTWNHPLKYDDNFDIAVFDRTHVAQLGFLYELPFFKESQGAAKAILGGWQVNGIAAWYTGLPFAVTGINTPLNCQGCGTIYIDYNGDTSPSGSAGSPTEQWYDKSQFSQPSGLGAEGFGNTSRSTFRMPSVWNVDLSLFKSFQLNDRSRLELRVEAANVFNHPNWLNPVNSFTANNFMQFTPSNSDSGGTGPGSSTATPGPRRVQLGLRFEF